MTETTRIRRERRNLMIWIVALDATVIGAFAIGLGLEGAAWAAMLMLAFTAFFVIGRGRTGTAEVVSGVGDERTRLLYLRSTSFTGLALGAVIVGWLLVTVIQGDPDSTLSTLALVFNAALIGSAAYYSRRG